MDYPFRASYFLHLVQLLFMMNESEIQKHVQSTPRWSRHDQELLARLKLKCPQKKWMDITALFEAKAQVKGRGQEGIKGQWKTLKKKPLVQGVEQIIVSNQQIQKFALMHLVIRKLSKPDSEPRREHELSFSIRGHASCVRALRRHQIWK